MEVVNSLYSLTLALSLGVFTILICKRINIVAIGPLLIVGVIFGSQGFNIINSNALDTYLNLIISFGVSIILFEGALSLDYSGYRKVGRVITRLLSLGLLTTWVVNALAIYWLFDLPLFFCFFASSLVVVTGPTVISPLLRRVKINKRLYNILHWEGVLIDPIGVFLAILCFEIVNSGGTQTLEAFLHVVYLIANGVFIGLIAGLVSVTAFNKRWLPEEMLNAFFLCVAIGTFAICDYFFVESGILGVVVAGMTIGIMKKRSIEEIKRFNLQLTEIFIGFLFIVLASGLDLSQLQKFALEGVAMMLILLFFTRPFSIFLCSLGSNLKMSERLFLGWTAPRGIIAASIATIFTLAIKKNPSLAEYAWFIETFTFTVISTTVVFQGFTAPWVAKFLRVSQKTESWVLIGAHDFSEQIYRFLESRNCNITIIDNNLSRVELFKTRGLNVLYANSLSPDVFDTETLFNTSKVLALTDNIELNRLICLHWLKMVKDENLFRWSEWKQENETKGTFVGDPVWLHLEKPSSLSLQLAKGTSSVQLEMYSSKQEEDPDEKVIPLMYPIENGAQLVMEEEAIENKQVLTLRIKSKKNRIPCQPLQLVFYNEKNPIPILKDLIHRSSILVSFKKTTAHLKILEEKIKEGGMCIGGGMAIATLTIPDTDSFSLLIAKIPQGIDLNSFDKQKVQLLFFITYPPDKQKEYFSLISYISRQVSNPKKIEYIKDMATLKEFQDLFEDE